MNVPDVRSDVGARHRRATRAATVGAAIFAAAVTWVVAVPALGVELRVNMAGQPPMAVGLPQVVLTVLVVSLAGWALLAILERATTQARTIWTAVATAVLVLSYAAPLTAGAASATTTVLVVMHSIVGLTLIVGLRRTVETRRPVPSRVQPQPTRATDPKRATAR